VWIAKIVNDFSAQAERIVPLRTTSGSKGMVLRNGYRKNHTVQKLATDSFTNKLMIWLFYLH